MPNLSLISKIIELL